MQDKPSTVAAYAVGASLAAIALFYVFGPNYTIDHDDQNTTTTSQHKRSIVGLTNPANDCFVNSALQALAGMLDLRLYLIREIHRRDLDGPEVYDLLPGAGELRRGERLDKIREMQQGTITRALKVMLDGLNERPIHRKSISARPFLQALEFAYRTRINRNQQDAQEFLQIVTERLCDEYHAGVKARKRWRRKLESEQGVMPEGRIDKGSETSNHKVEGERGEEEEEEEDTNENGFPFEGQLESQIECQFCHYQYKPNKTSFFNLTLQVPQANATTLSSCFDGLLKTEYIDDFRCDRCRLRHAVDVKMQEIKSEAPSDADRERLEAEVKRIQEAVDTDPEQELDDEVALPPSEWAPKRKIARHMRITVFPKIIAIHLSRSIYDQNSSSKNAAKVSFPERLSLGGILSRRWFTLLSIVCHKGSHHSGHYETFRRNQQYPPFSTPDALRSYADSRMATTTISAENATPANNNNTPSFDFRRSGDQEASAGTSSSTSSPSLSGASAASSATTTQLITPPAANDLNNMTENDQSSKGATATTTTTTTTSSLLRPALKKSASSLSVAAGKLKPQISTDGPYPFRRKHKNNHRWWRISDEKTKECKTSDVLDMQKEVYLLFYEIEQPGSSHIRNDA